MSSSNDVDLDLTKLARIIKTFTEKPPTIRVGILGAKASASKIPKIVEGKNQTSGSKATTPKKTEGVAPTNAEVGAAHEFGTKKIPARSFLNVPLYDHLANQIETTGVIDPEILAKTIEAKSLMPLFQQIAVIAESIVLNAFETGGYGKWPAWKDPDYTNEGGMLLVDSGQLRDSITSEVKK